MKHAPRLERGKDRRGASKAERNAGPQMPSSRKGSSLPQAIPDSGRPDHGEHYLPAGHPDKPGSGTEVDLPGKDFARRVFSVWLGKHPVDDELKRRCSQPLTVRARSRARRNPEGEPEPAFLFPARLHPHLAAMRGDDLARDVSPRPMPLPCAGHAEELLEGCAADTRPVPGPWSRPRKRTSPFSGRAHHDPASFGCAGSRFRPGCRRPG